MTYVKQRAEKLGLPIVDATTTLVVAVVRNDVVNALKKDSKRCAFSRAAMRITGVKHAFFFKTAAYLEYQDRMVYYLLPPSVQKEIVSFDRAQVLAPGVYQLSPPGNLRPRRLARDRTEEKRRMRQRRLEGLRHPIIPLPQVNTKTSSRDIIRAAGVIQDALTDKSKSGLNRGGITAGLDNADKLQVLRDDAKERGMCSSCRARPAPDGYLNCEPCRTRVAEANRIARATKQTTPRMTLVTKTKYVRDINDPDSITGMV